MLYFKCAVKVPCSYSVVLSSQGKCMIMCDIVCSRVEGRQKCWMSDRKDKKTRSKCCFFLISEA